jgi:DNA (cytosine-5)-methyltransferase 1
MTENRTARIQNLIRAIPKNGGSRSALGKKNQLPCHQKSDGFKDVYGRMFWDKPAPTITSGCQSPSKGRFLHPSEDRTISLREAAILQGFPANYLFSMKNGKLAAARMIGNAVPPAFVSVQAAQLRSAIALSKLK